jgi:hypothetical protein
LLKSSTGTGNGTALICQVRKYYTLSTDAALAAAPDPLGPRGPPIAPKVGVAVVEYNLMFKKKIILLK